MNTVQAILRLSQVIRRQHKAFAAEESYAFWLRRYMAAIDQMPDTLASNKKLEQFLTGMVSALLETNKKRKVMSVVYRGSATGEQLAARPPAEKHGVKRMGTKR